MRNILQVIVVVLVIGLAGCAHPQYESRMVPFNSNPSTSADQADSICRPQAQMAASKARANAQVNANYQRQRAAQTPYLDSGSFSSGYESSRSVREAYSETFNTIYESCLSQYGWRIDRYCVKNCR